MPNLFITRDAARGYFWEAIPKVHPEAFEDLASIVDDYLAYLENEKTTDQTTREIVEEEAEGSEGLIVVHWGYEEKGTILDWQRRWNLAGREERSWVSMLAMSNLALWAGDSDSHQQRRLIAICPDTRPVFELPYLTIDEHENWQEFGHRATQIFSQTLAEYKDAVKDVGAFQRNTRRDARWLAAHQVAGLSWHQVAETQDHDTDDSDQRDHSSVQRAANRFAAYLPLTPRT